MPLYEFTCRDCGHNFTILASWEKKKEAACPRCGSEGLREVWGGFSSPGCGPDTGGFT
ncbi:MAG: zinc ribbon domain-containing protein [Firmicutes bacterium]|nr:zinc ribbon domain-containing protein [Bacillota bacterium]